MATRRETEPLVVQSTQAPAITSEQREQQLVSLAFDVAEQQLRSGKASSQVIVHYLKLGSSREQLEQKRLEMETSVLVTKKELMESQKNTESLMKEALLAMRTYTGNGAAINSAGSDD